MEDTYTGKQVTAAIDRAEDLLSELFEFGSLPERDQDLLNIFINALVTVLERPEGFDDLDDVLNANWVDSDYNENGYDSAAKWVRSWWDWS